MRKKHGHHGSASERRYYEGCRHRPLLHRTKKRRVGGSSHLPQRLKERLSRGLKKGKGPVGRGGNCKPQIVRPEKRPGGHKTLNSTKKRAIVLDRGGGEKLQAALQRSESAGLFSYRLQRKKVSAVQQRLQSGRANQVSC